MHSKSEAVQFSSHQTSTTSLSSGFFLQSQVNLRTRRAGSFRTKGGGAVVDHSPALFTGFCKKYFLMPIALCL